MPFALILSLTPTPLPEGEGLFYLLPRGEGPGMRENLRCALSRFLAFVLGFPHVHRRAGADEVAVAVDLDEALDRGPVFVGTHAGRGEGGSLAAVGVRPFAGEFFGGVRGVLQRVIQLVPLALLHLFDFAVDRDHGVAEAIELFFRFALGRLDHQRVDDRE